MPQYKAIYEEKPASRGVHEATNFQTKLNALAKDGWEVVFSNVASYEKYQDLVFYALLRKDD